MDTLNVNKVLKFLQLVHNLKYSPRVGWVHHKIEDPEKIACHMYTMSIMTFLIGNDTNLDRLKCMQLALVHDLAECIVGDITPKDNIPPEIKHDLETTAMKELTELLGDDIGKIIYDIFMEYEAQETPEAKFVKDLDRFDMIFTAATYERKCNEPGKLEEFFECTNGKFQHPFIKKLASGLVEERGKMINKK